MSGAHEHEDDHHDSDEGDDEELDPRVEGALGRLNAATDDINKSEKDLDAAKKAFKEGMAQMQVDLAVAAQKCGKKAIERARPYHAALFQAKKSHFDARRAAQMYEQASAKQKLSKNQVAKFEKTLMKGGQFDPKLQSKLNAATQNVAEADRRKRIAAEMHARTTQGFLTADQELMQLAKTRKKVILKTQPYFVAKDKHDKSLTALKKDLQKHEAAVKDAKKRVAAALKELETISNEIHEQRKEKKKHEAPAGGGEGEGEGDKSGKDGKPTGLAARIAEAQAKEAQREMEQKEREAREKAEDADAAAAAAEAARAAAAAVTQGVDDEDDISLAEADGVAGDSVEGEEHREDVDTLTRDMQELMTSMDAAPGDDEDGDEGGDDAEHGEHAAVKESGLGSVPALSHDSDDDDHSAAAPSASPEKAAAAPAATASETPAADANEGGDAEASVDNDKGGDNETEPSPTTGDDDRGDEAKELAEDAAVGDAETNASEDTGKTDDADTDTQLTSM